MAGGSAEYGAQPKLKRYTRNNAPGYNSKGRGVGRESRERVHTGEDVNSREGMAGDGRAAHQKPKDDFFSEQMEQVRVRMVQNCLKMAFPAEKQQS